METVVRIELKAGKLVLMQKSGRGPVTFSPTFRDGFNAGGGTFFFQRDAKGKITGFLYSVWRARNMRFVRIE